MASEPDFDVEVYGADGSVIGTKKWNDLNWLVDSVNGICVLAVGDNNKLVLCPAKELDALDIYSGRLSCLTCTVCRHQETKAAAANRAIEEFEIIDTPKLALLGEGMENFTGDSKHLITVFAVSLSAENISRLASRTSIKTISASELGYLINDTTRFSPLFLAIWKRYGNLIKL